MEPLFYITLVDITVFVVRADDLAQQHAAHTGQLRGDFGCNAGIHSAAQHTGCMAEQRTEMLIYAAIPNRGWILADHRSHLPYRVVLLACELFIHELFAC